MKTILLYYDDSAGLGHICKFQYVSAILLHSYKVVIVASSGNVTEDMFPKTTIEYIFDGGNDKYSKETIDKKIYEFQ